MKHLNDYIIEKQQINEAGLRDTLFGEIVMKILGTGLDWIHKGVAWIADTVKEGVAGAWSASKGLGQNIWEKVYRDIGYTGKIPTSEREFSKLQNYILEPKDTKERLKRCTEFYNALLKAGVDKETAGQILANITGAATLPVLFDDKTDEVDKKIIQNYLTELKKKHPKEYDQIIKRRAKAIENAKKKEESKKQQNKKDTKGKK